MEKEQLIKLVTAAQSGDSNAQGELFSCFYNDIYYFALKTIKDDDLACDITQEAFVEIINTITALKEPAAFVTWAKQITYHQCTRYFKKKKDVIVGEDEDGHSIFDDLKEENNWEPDFDALEKMDLSNVKLMWANYPNMPTGANANEALFQKMVQFAQKHQIVVVMHCYLRLMNQN